MSFGTPTTSSEPAATNNSAPAPMFGAESSNSTRPQTFGQANVFGQAKPLNLFGNAANSAPSGGIFGSAQPKPSPLGLGAGASDANKADSSSGMLGGSSTGTPSILSSQRQPTDAATNQQSVPAVGLFANTGNSLFGNKNVDAPATTAPGLSTPTKPVFSTMSASNAPGAQPADSLFKTVTTNAASRQAAGLSTPAKPIASVMSTTPAEAPPSSLMMKPATTSTSFKQAGGTAQPSTASNLFSISPAAASTSNSGGLFGAAKPDATSNASPFGQLAANSSAAPGNTSAAPPSGSLFSKPASSKPAEETPAASTAPPASSASKAASGSSLFAPLAAAGAATAKPSSSSPFALATSSVASAPQPATAAPASEGSESKAPAAATSSAASVFGGVKPAAATGTNDLNKGKDVAQPPAQNGSTNPLGASTSGPTSQLPRLKNKTMEDIITRWASDLSKYQKEFKEQATVVSQWDRNLVENGEKIQKLYLDTFEAERASNEIERQLVTVESQQDELEAWLDRYESEVQEMFAKQLGPGEQLTGPDQERERTYKLAEKLTQHLDEKSRDLSKMVKEINDISGTLSKGIKAEDPLSQIVRVLNDHLTQLQWIDSNTAVLTAKIAAAHKAGSVLSSNHARLDSDAAESFYRSYMGGRR